MPFLIKYNRNGEVEWATNIKGIGESSFSSIDSIAITNEGGYIVGGEFSADAVQVGNYKLTKSENCNTNGIIIKYDSSGEVEWATNIGGTGDNSNPSITIESVDSTEDGGILVGGSFSNSSIQVGNEILTNNSDTYGLDFNYYSDTMIIKYDSSGEVEWATSIGGNYSDNIVTIRATNDGGCIAGGSFSSTEIQLGDITLNNNSDIASTPDGMIIKYDSTGEIEWAKNIAGEGVDSIDSILLTSDGGYIAVGIYTGSISLGDYTLTNKGSIDGMIIKYDVEGHTEWATSIGESEYEDIYSIDQINDGSYIVVGELDGNGFQIGDSTITDNGNGNGMIIKFENKEIIEPIVSKAVSIGGDGDDYFNVIKETSDGGFIAGGMLYGTEMQVGDYTLVNKSGYDEYGVLDPDGIIIKYDASEKVEWATSIGEKAEESINALTQTNDGGFIVGGSLIVVKFK